MLGVVLWSDASDGKAVIWCEDQGDLAFLNAPDDIVSQDVFFDAGDLVQFEMEEQATLRRARNTRLLAGQAGSRLPEALRRGIGSAAQSNGSAEVIPFKRFSTEPRTSLRQLKQG